MARTLIVATTSYAGMGPYVSEIVNNFSAEDDVYYFFRDFEDDFFFKNIKKELHEKSVFFKLANSIRNKLIDLVTGRLPYEKEILRVCVQKGIEVVHFINRSPSIHMQKALEKKRIKYIGTVHDLHPHEAKKAWYKLIRFRVDARRMFQYVQRCPWLVTNSKSQFDELLNLFPSKKIEFFSFPSLVTDSIKSGKDVPCELENVQKPYILFFGRFEEYKGIKLLYDAFCGNELLKEKYNLVLAGSGWVDLGVEKVDPSVIMINRYIKDSEVAALFSKAAAAVYPYISATQSGVLSLAFYYQLPTLTSDVPFFKSIMSQIENGMMFESGNISNLTTQMSRMLSRDNSVTIRSQKSYYELNYDGSVIYEKLRKIYAQ